MPQEQNIADAFLKSVGQSIERKRKEKGWSMADLGNLIGVDRMQVNHIEKGQNITMTTLLKISLALGVKPDELIKFNARTKKEDLEFLVDNNKASKLEKKTPSKKGDIITVTDKDFIALRKKTKSKELDKALLDWWDKLKGITASNKKKAS